MNFELDTAFNDYYYINYRILFTNQFAKTNDYIRYARNLSKIEQWYEEYTRYLQRQKEDYRYIKTLEGKSKSK